jgi:hypothetical protein
MKTKPLTFELRSRCLSTKGLSLDQLLREAAQGEAIFLKVGGRVRFVLMTADEGDQEAHALRANSEFMAYLDEVCERAKKGPWKTLEQVRRDLAIPRSKKKARPKAKAAS